MVQKITIGRYLPGNSVFHRLHPVSKIIMLVLSMVAILLLPGLKGLLLGAIYTCGLLLAVRRWWSYLLGGLKPLWLIIAITFIFQMVGGAAGETLLAIGSLQITDGGLLRAVNISGRLVLVVLLASLLTSTTTPMALTYGLEKLLHPFKYIGLPTQELALMISIALGFIPLLLSEATMIMQAQVSRGAAFGSGGPIRRLGALVPLLIPLLASALRRAEDLATAMEARGYRGAAHRTSLHQWQLRAKDYLAVASALVLLIITIFIPRGG